MPCGRPSHRRIHYRASRAGRLLPGPPRQRCVHHRCCPLVRNRHPHAGHRGDDGHGRVGPSQSALWGCRGHRQSRALPTASERCLGQPHRSNDPIYGREKLLCCARSVAGLEEPQPDSGRSRGASQPRPEFLHAILAGRTSHRCGVIQVNNGAMPQRFRGAATRRARVPWEARVLWRKALRR